MAKGNRKRAKQNTPSTGLATQTGPQFPGFQFPQKLPSGFVIKQKPQVIPLTQDDGKHISEMVELNNTFAAMDNQIKQMDAAITMLQKKKDKIMKGEIGLPVMIGVTRNMLYAEGNKDKVVQHIDDEIAQIRIAKSGVTGSLEHRRDEYAECVLRVYKILGSKIPSGNIDLSVKGIRPKAKEVAALEKESIEKEFDQLQQIVEKEAAKKE